MKKQNRQLIWLGVLLVALIALAVSSIRGRKQPAPVPAPEQVAAEGNAEEQVAETAVVALPAAFDAAPETFQGADPFLTFSEARKRLPGEEPGAVPLNHEEGGEEWVEAGIELPPAIRIRPTGDEEVVAVAVPPALRPGVRTWTGAGTPFQGLKLTGIVLGPKTTAIIQDGWIGRIVEPGSVVRRYGALDVKVKEVGRDFVTLQYGSGSQVLRLREEVQR